MLGREGMSDPNNPFWKVLRQELPVHPLGMLMGWRVLEAHPDSGRARVQFEIDGRFANPMGNVQGGIITAMLDDAMGPALATTFGPNEFAPTLELKVNFFRPGTLGTFVAEGTVRYRSKTVAFLQGELFDTKGDLIATATATSRVVRVEPKDQFLKA